MINYKKVGAYISELRKKNDLTQMELAERMNITHQAVSKWENGIALPDTEMLFRLSKLFTVSVDELLNGENSISNENKEKGERAAAKETASHEKDAITYKDNHDNNIESDDCNECEDEDESGQNDNEEYSIGYLCGLAPYLDCEALGNAMEKVKEIDIGNLTGIAPFLRREAVDKAALRITDEEIDLFMLTGLASYISKTMLEKLFEKVKEYDIFGIVGLAPFLHSSTIEKAISRMNPGSIKREDLSGLAPFISRELLNKLFLNSKYR